MKIEPTHYEVCMRGIRPHLAEARKVYETLGVETLMRSSFGTVGNVHTCYYVVVEHLLKRGTPVPGIEHNDDLLQLGAILALASLGSGHDLNRAKQEHKSMLMLAVQLVSMTTHGQHSYVLSKDLAEQLVHTELRGLHGTDLALPHPTIYVEVPPELGLSMAHFDDQILPLRGLYLSSNQWDDFKGWSIMCIGSRREGPLTAESSDLFHSAIELSEDSLDNDVQRRMKTFVDTIGMRHRNPADRANAIGSWVSMFKWVLNVVVYMTWPEADLETIVGNPEASKLLERIERAPKGHPRRRRLLDELKGIERRDRTLLGRHVVWQRPSVWENEPGTGTGQPLTKRVLVSGHWRNQPIGEGRQQRKRIWIQPFWRGPVGAEQAEATTHVVD